MFGGRRGKRRKRGEGGKGGGGEGKGETRREDSIASSTISHSLELAVVVLFGKKVREERAAVHGAATSRLTCPLITGGRRKGKGGKRTRSRAEASTRTFGHEVYSWRLAPVISHSVREKGREKKRDRKRKVSKQEKNGGLLINFALFK